ncbi:hypothetical protein J4G65_05945, partial [Aeromonas allosaccharophila]|uniref:hypothetical protein n=1 Tax=Aeromonas allosaccharophila TaxID=656 RepID=UPI001BCB332D
RLGRPFCYVPFLSLGFIILSQKAVTPCCFVSKSRPFLVTHQQSSALLSVKTGICRGRVLVCFMLSPPSSGHRPAVLMRVPQTKRPSRWEGLFSLSISDCHQSVDLSGLLFVANAQAKFDGEGCQ